MRCGPSLVALACLASATPCAAQQARLGWWVSSGLSLSYAQIRYSRGRPWHQPGLGFVLRAQHFPTHRASIGIEAHVRASDRGMISGSNAFVQYYAAGRSRPGRSEYVQLSLGGMDNATIDMDADAGGFAIGLAAGSLRLRGAPGRPSGSVSAAELGVSLTLPWTLPDRSRAGHIVGADLRLLRSRQLPTPRGSVLAP